LLTWPPDRGPTARWWRRLNFASAEFALLADVAMGAYGGDLKRREKITGRFADWFSALFLASASLRRFLAEGKNPAELPFVTWAVEHCLHRMQVAREGLYANLRLPGLGGLLRWPGAAWAKLASFGQGPDDSTGHRIARAMLQPGEVRDRLTTAIYHDPDPNSGLGRLEHALAACTAAEPVLKKLKGAVRAGRLPKARPEQVLDQAVEQGLISDAERDLVQSAEEAREEAVAVDSFGLDEYLHSALRTDVGAAAH
ncbi:MAG: acyl-CoA dehydrogenase domain-containing protein, partial [Planctomycetota bacterium]